MIVSRAICTPTISTNVCRVQWTFYSSTTYYPLIAKHAESESVRSLLSRQSAPCDPKAYDDAESRTYRDRGASSNQRWPPPRSPRDGGAALWREETWGLVVVVGGGGYSHGANSAGRRRGERRGGEPASLAPRPFRNGEGRGAERRWDAAWWRRYRRRRGRRRRPSAWALCRYGPLLGQMLIGLRSVEFGISSLEFESHPKTTIFKYNVSLNL